MFTIKFILLSVFVVSIKSVPIKKATAYLDNGTIQGQITFTDLENGKVAVQGSISGVSEGLYGFHIHERGDLSRGCTSALSHYNPDGVNHGGPQHSERHAGDLGNIAFGSDGVANINFEDGVIALEGRYGIVGRALVLHEGVDDLGEGGHADSLSTGNAGGRAACTVIGILE